MIYDYRFQKGRGEDKKKKGIYYFIASHKSINEWERSINKTAARYFSDKLYKANISPLHFKTAFLEDLS